MTIVGTTCTSDTIISWRLAHKKRKVSWTNHGESPTLIRIEDEFGRFLEVSAVYGHTDRLWNHHRLTEDIAALLVRQLDGLAPVASKE